MFRTIRGAVELTRPMNAVAAGVLTFIGTFVGGDPFSTLAVIAVLATVLATGAGNSINDFLDREIDAINVPDRPIPRGAVSPRLALWQSALLMGSAVLLALTLPFAAIIIAIVNLLALITYTSIFKGLPGVGNAVVAFLVGSTFLFGGAAVAGIEETVILFALAALATLGREIIKDVEDIVGDTEEGLNTLPIAIGQRRALLVAAACLVLASLSSPLPYLLGIFGYVYLGIVTLAIAIMVGGVLRSFSDPGRGQRFVKVGMFLGILAFIAGRVELLL